MNGFPPLGPTNSYLVSSDRRSAIFVLDKSQRDKFELARIIHVTSQPFGNSFVVNTLYGWSKVQFAHQPFCREPRFFRVFQQPWLVAVAQSRISLREIT